MKTKIKTLLLIMTLFLAGCGVYMRAEFADGKVVEYRRGPFTDQRIGNFIMEKDGSVLLENQESETVKAALDALTKIIERIP
jgi:hypothetical protein